MTSILFPLASSVIVTSPANSRAMAPEKIPVPTDAVLTRSVPEAIEVSKQAHHEDVIFITGSLFVVGEARALLAP